MILAHLTKHWLARREQYSFSSWILCVARSLRVLLFYRDHRRLCRLTSTATTSPRRRTTTCSTT